jgi:hypothetical protein
MRTPGRRGRTMEDGLNWESAWAEARVARTFAERLSGLSQQDRQPVLAPVLDRDPYLSAWTNVEAALGTAPAGDRARLQALLAELDARIGTVALPPSLGEAARRAVRALLARPWLLTPESLTFVYQPFESAIPLATLEE